MVLNSIKKSIINFLIFIKPRPYNIIKKNFKTYDPEFKVFPMYVYITEPLCQLISIVTYMVFIIPHFMNAVLRSAEINNFLCFVLFTIFITLLSYRFDKLDISIPLTDDAKDKLILALLTILVILTIFFKPGAYIIYVIYAFLVCKALTKKLKLTPKSKVLTLLANQAQTVKTHFALDADMRLMGIFKRFASLTLLCSLVYNYINSSHFTTVLLTYSMCNMTFLYTNESIAKAFANPFSQLFGKTITAGTAMKIGAFIIPPVLSAAFIIYCSLDASSYYETVGENADFKHSYHGESATYAHQDTAGLVHYDNNYGRDVSHALKRSDPSMSRFVLDINGQESKSSGLPIDIFKTNQAFENNGISFGSVSVGTNEYKIIQYSPFDSVLPKK